MREARIHENKKMPATPGRASVRFSSSPLYAISHTSEMGGIFSPRISLVFKIRAIINEIIFSLINSFIKNGGGKESTAAGRSLLV